MFDDGVLGAIPVRSVPISGIDTTNMEAIELHASPNIRLEDNFILKLL
jgi:hypothetical protein